MIELKVVAFEQPTDHALAEITRVLSETGYRVTAASDPMQFRNEVPAANCAVVLAYELASELIPGRLAGAYVPPIVLISTLPIDKATRRLKDPRIVYKLLQPAPPVRVFVATVTQAVIEDIMRRLADAAAHDPGFPAPLRTAIRDVVVANKRRVKSLETSTHVKIRTLEVHWASAFGSDSPKLADFCRGVELLRIVSEVIGEPDLMWSRVLQARGISAVTLRRTSLAFAGNLPSKLDLGGKPAGIITRVCARAIPTSRLLNSSLGGQES